MATTTTTVATFYTPNYSIYRDRFEKNISDLGYTFYYEQRQPTQQQKEANTKIKPYFIRDCLQWCDSVVWSDIDNIITRMDMSFEECDMAVLRQPKKIDGSLPTHPYTVGWIYFRSTPASLKFIDHWIRNQENMKHDHGGFTRTLRKANALDIQILDVTSHVEFLWNGSNERIDTNHQGMNKFKVV